MSVPDLGQQAGIRLYESARGGEFHMSADAARELAASCDRLVERVRQARADAAALTRVSGFPDLPSGRALTAGFEAKGLEYLGMLDAFEQAALRHKAAYLAAGALFHEADAANAAALAAALAETP
ncbi:hypothetical protein [Nocardia flavorosea]|uniref:PE family protein n=1 Tax=Nocardia flavorosea TaxID=53429 RepID=A0A846YG57_9NOCA|nr:hypothetical protein [Nocardia flavorosea]NKY56128.1 hypothetical protein [Nocardia flavorosea]